MVYIILTVGILAAFFVGRYTKYKYKVVELSDKFTPNTYRTKAQISNDAVLQLANELSKSGAIKIIENINSPEVEVKIKVVV